MTKVHAIYEKGVFRPTRPVQMNDGAQVELTIEESSTECGSMSIVTALEEIAKLPIAIAKDSFSGADHDRVLYSKHP